MDSKSQISSALDALDATFAEHQSYLCIRERHESTGWGAGVVALALDSRNRRAHGWRGFANPPPLPPAHQEHDRIVQASPPFQNPRDSDQNSYVGLGLGSIMPILNTGVGDGESSLSTIS